MDLHGADYIERDVPWGLHLWESLVAGPSPVNDVPILVNQKNEVFYLNIKAFTNVTDILMYLYSQAFSGRVRLYSTMQALEKQQQFDDVFYKATRVIFLATVLESKELSKKYIIDANRLNTWKAVNEVFWPALRLAYKFWFKVNAKSVDQAWKLVYEQFDQVEEELKTSSSKFMLGETITAADISFASHAALVLFPNAADSLGSGLRLRLPLLSELSSETREKVEKLRETKAGKYAISLYKNGRGTSKAKYDDCYALENNPAWSHSVNHLRTNLGNLFFVTVIPILVPFLIEMDWSFRILWWVIFGTVMYFTESMPEPHPVPLIIQRGRKLIELIRGTPQIVKKTKTKDDSEAILKTAKI